MLNSFLKKNITINYSIESSGGSEIPSELISELDRLIASTLELADLNLNKYTKTAILETLPQNDSTNISKTDSSKEANLRDGLRSIAKEL